jgi:hypothetical protein
MKPFRQRDLESLEKNFFNYHISKARRIVENAFGIMAARFRIYRTQINLKLKHIESVVMASCALHNFLITSLPHCLRPLNALIVRTWTKVQYSWVLQQQIQQWS